MSKTSSIPLPTTAPPFPWLGLLTLSAAVFLSVTSEMLPTGLLPDMARTLDVSQSQVGLLVTWFAFTVVATSTSLAYLTRRMPRHRLIVAVLVVFAISNVLTAVAPSYEFVVASRVLGGMAHGLFWAVVGAYAAHLVPKEQIGRAVSVTIAGGTVAFIFGVPLATAVGHVIGWQLSFLALAALMLAGAVVVWRFLPEVDHYVAARTDGRKPKEERRDGTLPAVVLLCVITALTMVAHFTLYTYIAPFLIERLGVSGESIAPLLFAYGIAGAVGLLLAGTVLGRRPRAGLLMALVGGGMSIVVLVVFTGLLPVAIAAFVLWGLAFGALPSLLQTRLLHTASRRIRDTASAFYTTAFNAGIGGGALVGALLLGVVGLEGIPFVYLGVLATSVTLVLVSDRVGRRRASA